jgi:hypothetical protein
LGEKVRNSRKLYETMKNKYKLWLKLIRQIAK